jgi:hypothetical protein
MGADGFDALQSTPRFSPPPELPTIHWPSGVIEFPSLDVSVP